jgi:16S rRNA (cytidine1402-2'-O)-methyltransferase
MKKKDLEPNPEKGKLPFMYGKLYIVATPIGNTLDLSPRARQTLESVAVVACEDTRVFEDLARRAGFKFQSCVSYHDHNEKDISEKLIARLKSGQDVALVSDAGTPGISDPGFNILKCCYEEAIQVISNPGPSSVTSALSVCPIGGTEFAFMGFAPSRDQERLQKLEGLSALGMRAVFFESPHRIREHLLTANTVFPNEKIFVAREMTKTYEEYQFDTPAQLLEKIKGENERGEFVIVYPALSRTLSPTELEKRIAELLKSNRRTKEILEILATQTKMPRSDLYDLILEVKSKL